MSIVHHKSFGDGVVKSIEGRLYAIVEFGCELLQLRQSLIDGGYGGCVVNLVKFLTHGIEVARGWLKICCNLAHVAGHKSVEGAGGGL